jgi:hypothetical protein
MPTIYRQKETFTSGMRGRLIMFIAFLVSFSSCSKLIEVDPPVTNITSANAFNSDATAISALTGFYASMSNNSSLISGLSSLSLYPGLSADELTLYSGASDPVYVGYYTNSLTNSNTTLIDFWKISYPIIFNANSALEGLDNADALTPVVKQQLMGEAKFIRAFCYFYLVNLYGDVPLVTSVDYKVNALLPRTSKDLVWKQIIQDLKDAQNLLSPIYLDVTLLKSTLERVRPSSGTATALLARAYLYLGEWSNAEKEATSLINNSVLYSICSLDTAFLKNSNEAIWQLQPVIAGQNTPDAWVFVIPPTGPSTFNPVYLSNNLLNSFVPGDLRRSKWIKSDIIDNVTYSYPFKYKSASYGADVTEYETVFRLGEQFLIRAEARANESGNLNEAAADLNVIRRRAGLLDTSFTTQSALLSAIQHERQVELFTEWGHRWLDLKRTTTVDAVMGGATGACQAKGGKWKTNWQWYPIPLSELQADPNLLQNTGY